MAKLTLIIIIGLVLAVLALVVILCAFGALVNLLAKCVFGAFGIREQDLPKKKRSRIWSDL